MGIKEYSRSERVADQIQREVAEIIAQELEDPRVQRVTVSGASVSKDLSNATLYVTLPADADVERALEGLNRACGFVRRRLGQRVHMRYVPRLRFSHDVTLERATRVGELIDAAKRGDRETGDAAGEDS
ncbi:MAG: 30S ribosome-binding factor RbfA [Gammaproteobacteria bacterium]|nr:30S ribosome-binding factor RbfA [Gammaproteobacteria bacterium]NIM73896.1 30S ribosome-binding factor RbfA [Gammaproteobacteria bacterium]NIN38084.1 30S ribosome-binding factor RbfA [Gammaproteobacteria bacterium]NIO25677.1 30S ribosome-binding factor RbfA [Gammaproteobacteria bacterium]NIO66311.1 30S ribosome-binding factor RbfA [Gammaproteobacteria bacterium]